MAARLTQHLTLETVSFLDEKGFCRELCLYSSKKVLNIGTETWVSYQHCLTLFSYMFSMSQEKATDLRNIIIILFKSKIFIFLISI